MKTVNVYNSNYNTPVVIILNSNERIQIDPKQTVQIKTNAWFKTEEFKAESIPNFVWREQYQGRYSENLILRLCEYHGKCTQCNENEIYELLLDKGLCTECNYNNERIEMGLEPITVR